MRALSTWHPLSDQRAGGARDATVSVAVLVGLGMVSTAVASLGAPLLPTIMAVDHVSLASSQWALTISLVVGAVAAPTLGRLGDGRHRRQVIIATTAVVVFGCVLAALPLGFGSLLVGRALQGVGIALVPLAIAVARDHVPEARRQPTISLLGITTALGIGIGYPLAGVIDTYLGLAATFWAGAVVSGLGLLAAIVTLPPSPDRPGRPVDFGGAVVLALFVSGLLVVLAEGQSWGWASPTILAIAAASVVLLAVWVAVELRSRTPLVDLRLIRRRLVLAANATMLLVGVGIYPLLSLVVRLVQTPTATGYGFGASALIAGVMLVPFSVASFVANRLVTSAAKRSSPEAVVAISCVVLIASMVGFLLARTAYWELLVTMALAGLGVGGIFASNPVQITKGVPNQETGSAMGFYQVVRAVSFSAGSALSATMLVIFTVSGHTLPSSRGYGAAAAVNLAILLAALVVATGFALWPSRTGEQPSGLSASR